MSGAIIDFEDERARHGHLFERENVLARIRRFLVGEHALPRGWVLLLGSPGIGKSAILARILETLPEPMTPHHFIRRGIEGWDRPEVVVQNLCAQAERMFEEQGSSGLPSEARLGELLKRLSKNVLLPFKRRLILVLDGLDEVASDASGKNPLPHFLPRVLPPGVVILCASRPTHPHLHWLKQLDGIHSIDLDDRAYSLSNEAACRAFWQHHVTYFSPPLDRAFVDEAVRRAGGNLLHAIRLRDWLEDQPFEQRVATNIPHGLEGFLEQIWTDLHQLDGERCALVKKGLGIACVAREALPAYLFGELLGWSRTNDSEEFLRATRPFLLEEAAHWHNGTPAYRPYHDSFREFVSSKLGEPTIREYHGRIAETLAAWPPDEHDTIRRTYALRHAVAHRLEAGNVRAAQRLCADVGYLEMKCRHLGVTAIEQDLEATVRAPGGDVSFDLTAVLAAVSAEANHLRADSSSLPALLYNRLRCAGWSAERIEKVLCFPAGLPPLRLLHRVRLGSTLLRSFLGHEKPVVACVAMPDRSHFLSASADRTLRLWTLRSSECVAVLSGHDDELTACAVTPDGRTAISTSADATVKFWDLAARCCIGTVDNEGRWSTSCAVTPDGLSVVAGSDDGSLRIWDRLSRERIATLQGHTDYVTACVVTPDGGRLVSASRDGTVRVWDLPSGACLFTLGRVELVEAPTPRGMEEQQWITAIVVTPDGRYAIAAAGDGSLSQWDLASGRCVERFGVGQGRVDACAITRDGLHLLCGVADGTIMIWNLAAARCIGRLKAHAEAVSACSTTLDGRRVISASSDRSLKLWEIGSPESLSWQEGHAEPIAACAVTPDGLVAVSASEDRTLKVWDLATGACRVTLEGHEDLVTACAVSADGRRVVSGARDGSLRLWSVGSPEPTPILRAHDGQVSGCAIAADGRLVTASHDRTLRLSSLACLERVTILEGHGDVVDGCAITPDGTHALSLSRDGAVKLWDLATSTCKQSLSGLGGRFLCSALTPDGRRAVLAREDGTLDVRDLVSGQRTSALRGHAGRVFGCAVTPDGARVVSASEDATLKVWSLETGALLGTLHGTRWFRCVAVTNELICAGDQEGNLWMVASTGTTPSVREPPRRSARISFADLADVRALLAHLYPSTQEAQIIAMDARLDVTRIDLTGSALILWDAILAEACNQNRLHAIVKRAQRDFREHPDLAAFARACGLE